MSKKKFLIITSINPPTEPVKEFGKMGDIQVLVVGDKKTPSSYNSPGVVFLEAESSHFSPFRLSKSLPFNHYVRKNLGYLYAIQQGAGLIIDTDDDNFPLANYGFPGQKFKGELFGENLGWVNVYKSFTDELVWPRGYPLEQLQKSREVTPKQSYGTAEVGIWQGLANGDPDVDSIHRLVFGNIFDFNSRPPVVLGKGTWSPFNSQNTQFFPHAFPLLYLPSTVSFRYTDILRSVVAQPILWNAGLRLGFTEATVFQQRNTHDLVEDFISEIPMFTSVSKAARIAALTVSVNGSVSENLLAVYSALSDEGVVLPSEIPLLEMWLTDLNEIQG